MMQKDCEFSPIDYSKNKILPVSFEDFHKALAEYMGTNKTTYLTFCVVENGRLANRTINYHYGEKKYYYEEKVPTIKYYSWDSGYNYKRVYIDINFIEAIYEKFEPMYGEQYLENGKLLQRIKISLQALNFKDIEVEEINERHKKTCKKINLQKEKKDFYRQNHRWMLLGK